MVRLPLKLACVLSAPSGAGVSAPSGAVNTDSCESDMAEECADVRSARISPTNFVVSAMPF